MKRTVLIILAAVSILLMPGCNKSSYDGPGKLIIKVTDAPFPFSSIESATVTINKVEIRKAGDGVPDGNPFIVVSTEPKTFDLLDLRNGLVEELVNLEIPQGSYDLIRLYVDEAGLKVKDGGDYSVKVPSGQQTGIKLFIEPALIVAGGLTSEVLLDFDLSNSFVMRGNPDSPHGINGFIFKPVVRVVNASTAGTLEGMVTDNLEVNVDSASVWVKKDTIVASTMADSLGKYTIIGLPAGTYSVFAARENYDTVQVDGVDIVAGNKTILDLILTPKK
ncbi:MAG: DUF4382 domain-containing protein [Bacteroidales bacterium]